MALPMESQGEFEARKIPVLYTGVGKVNAAYCLTACLTELKEKGKLPGMVLNLGTAGSPVLDAGALVSCHKFMQRDMDVTPVGFQLGQTPFEDDVPITIQHKRQVKDLTEAVCGTGDNFSVGGHNGMYEIVDMEAYALAKVCHLMKVDFAAVKYITDGADGKAAADWNESLHKASKALA
ncbi:MAG: 5'-nucleosidase, partial [Alphaproteobacteria bacterium]|nr:5'-nucleosidase [Alphaproteobacteria bacterium]